MVHFSLGIQQFSGQLYFTQASKILLNAKEQEPRQITPKSFAVFSCMCVCVCVHAVHIHEYEEQVQGKVNTHVGAVVLFVVRNKKY